MTSSKKAECDWYDHEREIRKEAAGVSDLKVPASGMLSYTALDKLMKRTHNPDYLAEGLPRQTAQHVLKHVYEPDLAVMVGEQFRILDRQ